MVPQNSIISSAAHPSHAVGKRLIGKAITIGEVYAVFYIRPKLSTLDLPQTNDSAIIERLVKSFGASTTDIFLQNRLKLIRSRVALKIKHIFKQPRTGFDALIDALSSYPDISSIVGSSDDCAKGTLADLLAAAADDILVHNLLLRLRKVIHKKVSGIRY